MRIVIVTTENEPLNGVFWESYVKENGPVPDLIFFLKPRQHRKDYKKVFEPFFLFKPLPLVRLGFVRFLSKSLIKTDHDLGLHRGIIDILPTVKVERVNSLNQGPGLVKLVETKPDILVSLGKVEIFQEHVLEVPTACSINIHNGKLPDYKGLFATFWEVYQGEKYGGISIHVLTNEIDAGKLLVEGRVPLTGNLFNDLINKKHYGGRSLAKVLNNFIAYDTDPKNTNSHLNGYYSWPKMEQIIQFHWRCLINYRL